MRALYLHLIYLHPHQNRNITQTLSASLWRGTGSPWRYIPHNSLFDRRNRASQQAVLYAKLWLLCEMRLGCISTNQRSVHQEPAACARQIHSILAQYRSWDIPSIPVVWQYNTGYSETRSSEIPRITVRYPMKNVDIVRYSVQVRDRHYITDRRYSPALHRLSPCSQGDFHPVWEFARGYHVYACMQARILLGQCWSRSRYTVQGCNEVPW